MGRAPAVGQRSASRSSGSAGASASNGSEEPLPSGEILLAAIARSRDREAFRQLFNAFGPRIKRYLCARGAAEALAEEVVQDTMLKVWRKSCLYNPARARAATWIYSVARNCLVDRVRGERHPEIEADDPYRVAPTPPDEQLLLEEGRLEVTRAIQMLTRAEADVLRGAYFEGLSMSEIAERQALPLGTVKTRTRNALKRLRTMLRRSHD